MNLIKFGQTRSKPSDKVIPENIKRIMQQDVVTVSKITMLIVSTVTKVEKRNSIRNITDIA